MGHCLQILKQHGAESEQRGGHFPQAETVQQVYALSVSFSPHTFAR
jgi:hypothetical protein